MEELYRRMVFNVAARNQDDHTKNISFLMDDKGTWQLSPAYDVTYAYNAKSKWTKTHQLSINGKRDEIGHADLLAVARTMNIKKPENIITTVVDAVSQWKTFAKKANIGSDQIKTIGKTLLVKI